MSTTETPGGGAPPEPTLAAAGSDLPRFLRCDEAAELLRVAPATLRDWRVKRRGPRTIKVGGRVLWPTADVLAFAEHGEQQSA